MFRDDIDILTDILQVLPIEELETEFKDTHVSPLQIITFLVKKGIVKQLVTILKKDRSDATLLDIPRAVKFYTKLYKEMSDSFNDK